jgi:hypothetical protein
MMSDDPFFFASRIVVLYRTKLVWESIVYTEHRGLFSAYGSVSVRTYITHVERLREIEKPEITINANT